MELTAEKIGTVVQMAIEWQTEMGHWFLDGAKDAAVELAVKQPSKEAAISAIEQVLHDHRTVWAGDDPCDSWAECR